MTSLSHSAFSMKFSRGGGGGVSPFQMGVKSNISLKQGCIFFRNPPLTVGGEIILDILVNKK